MKHLSRSFRGLLGLATILAATESFAEPPSATSQPIAVPTLTLPPPTLPGLDGSIAWDSERKEVTVPNGTPQAQFTFNLTNISKETITISGVATSCGCTVAQLPQTPWPLAPGANGQISATMNLAGKSGTSVKTLTVNSDKGPKLLTVQATILPPPAAPAGMTAMDRESNQKLAIADRQAVFKGDCARCHVEPAKDKFGHALYDKACGICHEAEHRATMVTDLHTLKYPTTPETWKNWITHGKPGTLMPAFAIAEGGFLTDEQITSLVNYLVTAIPSNPAASATKPTAPAIHPPVVLPH